MSRVVEIRSCVDCPHRGAMWCDLKRRRLEVMDAYLEFPAWRPLPEKKEECDALRAELIRQVGWRPPAREVGESKNGEENDRQNQDNKCIG